MGFDDKKGAYILRYMCTDGGENILHNFQLSALETHNKAVTHSLL